MKESVFIIAEAGVNHDGNISDAVEMIKVAKCSGADAIKFQLFDADKLVVPTTPLVDYQKKDEIVSQSELLAALELSRDDIRNLANVANNLDIEFMCTAFDVDNLRFLVRDKLIKRIKISSGDLLDISLLECAAASDLPVILSTGMAYLEEVDQAVSSLIDFGCSKDRITILQCTSAYPTSVSDCNLAVLAKFKTDFEVRVGFSDHTYYERFPAMPALLALAEGATIIEKHFTLSRTRNGPDHNASLDPGQLKDFIEVLRDAKSLFGSSEKYPTDSELQARNLVRKKIVAKKALREGAVLAVEDIGFSRASGGMDPVNLLKIIGKRLRAPVEQYGTIEDNLLQD